MPPESKKLKAWHKVEAAMKFGEIVRPDVCADCGKDPEGKGGANLQAHHDDYNKPLDVKFLCKTCHMRHHHGKKIGEKKDNSTLLHKISIRKHLLKEVELPVIMETHGGEGVVFSRCYSGVAQGIVFEKLPKKTSVLAKQRPGWFVYEAECISGILSGAGATLPVNFLDVDPYGEPWPILQAFFECGFYKPTKLAIAVNDGLRQKLKLNGGWNVGSMKDKVEEYGNASMYKNYLEICKELVMEISSPHGYKLTKWAGYYCGSAKQMTHYAAVLCR